MKGNLTILSFVAALCLGVGIPLSAPGADNAAGLEFFESKIRPILVDNCYQCHSEYSKKVKGGLLLDTREGVLAGGDTGPAIKLGDPDQSLLIKAIRYTDDDLRMPPKNKKLSPEKIAALEAWVKMGAPDPRVSKSGNLGNVESIRAKAKTHWAFQPVKSPAPPTVKETRAVRTPVDNFIFARLGAAHLKPSPEADKRTLIRRATFDLTGLPPTPEDVAAFIADKSSNAYEKVVDRLLASPRYGERWGRHWLDVARYADTKGYVFEEDRHYPYAYTFRDYVIRAFNEDMPFDRFLKEQIAADLMTNAEKQDLAALGYLTLGRRFLNSQPDIIDDRIDVVCRGMMGLTVACARCHDHKYDPIPTKDYYSLYGIFASTTEPEEEPLLGTEAPAKEHAEYLTEHNKRVAERDSFRHEKEKEMSAELRAKSGDYLLAAHEVQQSTNSPDAESVAHKRKLDPEVTHRWMNALKEWRTNSNDIFTPWFAFAELPTNDFAGRSKELVTKWRAKQGAPISSNVLVANAFATNAPASMKEVAERYSKLLIDVDHRWQEALASTNKPAKLPDASAEALRQILYSDNAPANVPVSEFGRLYETSISQKLRALQRQVDELDATHPGAPPRAMALEDRAEPVTPHVFIRGNSGNPGPEVPRQFLEVLAGSGRKPFHKGSGRLELAEAIASTNNPLTARVFVNRVWLYHFGVPLVATPSDFGLRSEPPSHPELLDYLASRFMEDGWSVKKLHRLIMLSATYRQSSDDNPLYVKVDPGNQLLWRMNRQRLDFEALRDTLLSVSGKLDLKAGGHPVDITDTASTRRTVYGYIDRQNLPDLLRAFDFASPDTSSARRFYTTVPQQALFLMNSPFVIEQAKSLIDRPDFKASHTEKQQVRLLYQLAFQRDPTSEELSLAHQFTRGEIASPAPSEMTNWVFGYGSFDSAAKHVHFHKLPFFDGAAFQGGPTLPDPKLGYVAVNGSGGHPGNDQEHAAIRRWIAPRDGTITITGTLSHPDPQGDGVRGRIVSSQSGLLGEWVVHNDKKETRIEKLAVKQGEKIDFVTDCYGTVYFDSFSWPPAIRFLADGLTKAGQRMEWDSVKDFTEAAQTLHPALDAWRRYAQVLLLANELVFVD